MSRYMWIQLAKEIKRRASVEIGGGEKVSGATWLENECQRINATGENTLIYDFGEKGRAIFVPLASMLRDRTDRSWPWGKSSGWYPSKKDKAPGPGGCSGRQGLKRNWSWKRRARLGN